MLRLGGAGECSDWERGRECYYWEGWNQCYDWEGRRSVKIGVGEGVLRLGGVAGVLGLEGGREYWDWERAGGGSVGLIESGGGSVRIG